MSNIQPASPATSPVMVRIRISATIDNELCNRAPEHLPLAKLDEGLCTLTLEEAKAVLADAKFNSDLEAQTVGPNDMPLGVFNAYRALARQTEAAIKKAVGGAA